MYEYAIDNRRIMQRAYAALVAGDIRRFVKPVSPGIVGHVLEEVLHPFLCEVVDFNVEPVQQFTVTPGCVVISGRYTARRRADRARLSMAFRHEWQLSYGVAWRFAQRLETGPTP